LSWRARARRNGDGQGGQSLVEFALILPLMLLVITGLFDVARAVWQQNTLAYAAREGTRYAIVHGASGSPAADPAAPSCGTPQADPVICTQIPQVVRGAAVGVSSVATTVTYPMLRGPTECASRGCTVIVEASAPFIPLPSQYLLGGAFEITLRGGSQLVIQR
jgi:Flp pilus assembly protein TadG